ncbi:hypothetical protein OG455_25060 [Kitasatospora sp. NBC_01287]|uniref:hypothetical protein n=1 Tax=Kitasatospora sp. NBC_01287 TaxID=2903573 RepID=UPI002252D56B|nr:hypothetical protein [Kitasatospora sp. NBC_01287]MCX4748745.1 hypothetical protein [Kitasatospora sp. NBC_01287]
MRARHFAATGLLALALGLSGAGPAAAANPVIIEPDPVTPGSQFAVFDGGNCDSAGGQAVFHSREGQGSPGEDIPTVKLGSLRGLMGAMATVPERARPGVYDVTIQCTTVTKTQVTSTFTVHQPGHQDQQTQPQQQTQPEHQTQPDHQQSGRPEQPGQPGEPGPKGPTHAGLGGSADPDVPETVAGATLLATAGAAAYHQLRGRRSS